MTAGRADSSVRKHLRRTRRSATQSTAALEYDKAAIALATLAAGIREGAVVSCSNNGVIVADRVRHNLWATLPAAPLPHLGQSPHHA